MNAPFLFESWQFLAFRLGLCCNTWRNLRSLPLLDHDAASGFPINLGVLSEEDLHQYEVVFEFGEKAQYLAPSHQLAGGWEDDADAKVFGVALDFNAEEVWNGRNFSTQRKYTEKHTNLACILGNYLLGLAFLMPWSAVKGV